MAERGRPKAPLILTEEERQTLERWAQRRSSAQAVALRARIVLACAQGATNVAVATQLGIWPQTVAKWRGRFVGARLEGLADAPRPGRPRTIAPDQAEQVIVATLERPPPDHDTHWSTRSMARATGMNQTAISRIWRAFGLKPHLEQTWKLSADPHSSTHGDLPVRAWSPVALSLAGSRGGCLTHGCPTACGITSREGEADSPVAIV
jgi:transposase